LRGNKIEKREREKRKRERERKGKGRRKSVSVRRDNVFEDTVVERPSYVR
jgi:hypothetical protein